jgi:transcriptional regulator with XRE-family HTH domain
LVAEIFSFPKIIFGEQDMINHKTNTYADLVRFLSQRGRMLMLITVYQSLAQLHKGRSGAPLRALAKALGVSRSQAHNYLNGHSIPDDVTVRLVGLIKEDRRAYFFIQDIAAMILALAKAFSQYYRPHQFDFIGISPISLIKNEKASVCVGFLKFATSSWNHRKTSQGG